MPELALDDDQWHPLMRLLDRMCMTELMVCKRTADPAVAAVRVSCLRAADGSQWRPAVAPRITHNSAPTGNSRRMAIHGSS